MEQPDYPRRFELPKSDEQTKGVLAQGRKEHGPRFAVQHNGLGIKPEHRKPSQSPCPQDGFHPKSDGPFAGAGSGCPNKWVLQEGVKGQVTGFQTHGKIGVTENNFEVKLGDHLESTLQNAWDNSDAIFV